MTASKRQQLEPRAKKSFRFYNDDSKKYFVDGLPEIPYDLGEMYSGTIPVDKSDPSRSFFFVFEPTIGEPVDEVTIWFNGGPGCSSLEAFLQENGRFIWSWGMYRAQENAYTWVNLTNVLWVEYPIGLGFSEGAVTATSEEETAQDFLGFFKNFQEIFGISKFKIYVTGESYAGRYVPYVSAAMLDSKDTDHFDVKGALMYDPVIGQYEYQQQTIPIVPFVEEHSLFFNFNETFMDYLKSAHEYCGYANYTDYFLTYPPTAVQPPLDGGFNNVTGPGVDNCDLWNLVYEEAYRPNPCFNVYEISSMCPLLFDPLGFPSDIQYTWPGSGGIYFNRTDVKKAMHAPLNVSWSECGGPVFKGDGGVYGVGDLSLDPIQKILPKVIEATNRVVVGNGDYDMEILTKGTLLAIQNMTWNGKFGFQEEPSTPTDIKLPDLQYGQVIIDSGLVDANGDGFDGPGGQGIMGIHHYERGLMFVETYQSGHMQPQFQPRSSYRHMQWLLGRIEEL
ncbi:alpha/beta-hydrolase [Rhizodiscina lignyota]|uniref:Carboxypeptidase n=1 Tax=Rhizodiscina lignyota TaxID=1504668 RepID=A0A9P4ISA9_9PEZI|nr:alpha/beta-hydrolase [Rhizodiscina lignyota]